MFARAWISTWAPRMIVGGFVSLFLVHFAFVWKSSVNIPSDDEWSVVFRSPAAISLRWILSQHNEHRIVTTKFLIWLLYQINGWNLRTNIILNFIIFGVTVGWLIWVVKRLAPRMPLWVILGFAVFLLSPVLWMNHLIGLQVCFHFWLLSLLISTYFLFGSIQAWQRLAIGLLATIVSVYSLGTGLVSGPIVIFLFCLFKVDRAVSAPSREERAHEIKQLSFVAVAAVSAIAVWFVGFHKPENYRGLSLPFAMSFWRQFLNLVAFGFGIDRISSAIGSICLLIVAAPVVMQVIQKRGKLSTAQWTVSVTMIAILGTLASVAVGRAPFGIEWSKTSRYAEIGMPLIILSAVSWSWCLQRKHIIRVAVLVSLWLFCLISFSNNWSFHTYGEVAATKKIGVLCAQVYYSNGGDGLCPHLWPTSLADPFDRARQMNLSFYREITARIEFDRQQAINATASTPSYSGSLDVVNCQRIAGWATSTPRPPSWLDVELYAEGRRIGTFPAGHFRPDVYQAGAGPLLCGFDFPTPEVLQDGQPHSITVKVAGTSYIPPGTTDAVTCSPTK